MTVPTAKQTSDPGYSTLAVFLGDTEREEFVASFSHALDTPEGARRFQLFFIYSPVT